jgi:hypothetical protein
MNEEDLLIMNRINIAMTLASTVLMLTTGATASAQTVTVGGFTFDANAGADNAVLLDGSSVAFFDCNTSGSTILANLPGLTVDESAELVLTDGDMGTWIIGKVLADVSFTDNVVFNGPGPDLVVFEIGGVEDFNLAVFDPVTSSLTFSILYSPAVTAAPFACVDPANSPVNAAQIDLSDFGLAPGTRVESVRIDNLGVSSTSFTGADIIDIFALNSATITSCVGFQPPMTVYPVKAKQNRAFPLKMELFDSGGFELTGTDLVAPPVVQVIFTPDNGEPAIDVSDDVLSSGLGTDGNAFAYTDDGIWQFNLKSKNYSAPGEYLVTAVSGDESDYIFDSACVTSFVIK